MNKDKIDIIIARFLSGEFTLEEKEDLEKWILESDRNREYYEGIRKIWNSVKTPQPENIPDFEVFWGEVERKLSSAPQNIPFTQKLNEFISGIFISFNNVSSIKKISLGFTGILICIAAGILFNRTNKTTDEFLVYSADKTEIMDVSLPDGSTVKLRSGSRISLKKSFVLSRKVMLKGQAFFAVKHNDTPFIVNTSNASVEVVGTKFDVSASGRKTQVIVSEGIVKLKSSSEKNIDFVFLRKDQMSQCIDDLNPEPAVQVDAERLSVWASKKLIFIKTPLNNVIAELSRYYKVAIILKDKSIENTTISGEFGKQTADEALSALCLSINRKYIKQNGSYYIYKKK